MTVVSMVVAAAEDNAIGKNNELLWHLPDDFKFFKQVTMGHPVIMGRKTFDSLGKALPKRPNIVITRQKDYTAEGAEVVHSFDDAMRLAKEKGDDDIMVIGGSDIFALALPITNRVYLTRVHAHFPEADTHFLTLDNTEWHLVKSEPHAADEKHQHAFTFEVWERGNTWAKAVAAKQAQ